MKDYHVEYAQLFKSQEEAQSLIYELEAKRNYLARRYKILDIEIKELCDRFATEWLDCYPEAVQLLIELGFGRKQGYQELLFSSSRYNQWDCVEVAISTNFALVSKYPLSVKDEIISQPINIDWHTDTALAHQTFVEFVTKALRD